MLWRTAHEDFIGTVAALDHLPKRAHRPRVRLPPVPYEEHVNVPHRDETREQSRYRGGCDDECGSCRRQVADVRPAVGTSAEGEPLEGDPLPCGKRPRFPFPSVAAAGFRHEQVRNELDQKIDHTSTPSDPGVAGHLSRLALIGRNLAGYKGPVYR